MKDLATVDVLFERAHDPDPRLARVSTALTEAGFAVRVLAWDRSGRLPQHEVLSGVEIVRYGPQSHAGRGILQLAYLARAVLKFVPRVRSRRPAILHAIDLPMLLAALLMRPMVGRPKVVYEAFEIYAVMESRKYPGPIISLLHIAERLLPRHADLVIVPSEVRRRYFEARGIPSVVAGNWIDAPADRPTRAAARLALGLPDDPFVILYAGGLDPSRDLGPLLRHAATHPADMVIVAGAGVQAQLVREAAGRLSNVRFLGFVADPVTIVAAADALYYSLQPDHPYAAYAAPNNLFMAIAYGIPLVHRGQGDIGLVAQEDDIGEQFDGTSLDSAIDALRSPERRAQIAGAQARLRERYSWVNARRALLDVYPRPKTTTSSPRTNGP